MIGFTLLRFGFFSITLQIALACPSSWYLTIGMDIHLLRKLSRVFGSVNIVLPHFNLIWKYGSIENFKTQYKEMIFMKRRTLILFLLALTVFSLSGCKKEETPIESSSLAVIEPETSETISDKLDDDEAEDYVVPTIATTEAVIDEETVQIGITETLEDKSYIGITPDGNVLASMSLPELSSGHKYSEAEAVGVDNLAVYWSENNISKEDLRSRLDEEAYAGLSEQDKNEIVEQISSANPHNNPTETVPVEEETTANEGNSSVESSGTFASDRLGFDTGEVGIVKEEDRTNFELSN